MKIKVEMAIIKNEINKSMFTINENLLIDLPINLKALPRIIITTSAQIKKISNISGS
tara:strand:+ start:469 stop:639 length:171 start_codon:yes stop_codon:yes gene_type:complete